MPSNSTTLNDSLVLHTHINTLSEMQVTKQIRSIIARMFHTKQEKTNSSVYLCLTID